MTKVISITIAFFIATLLFACGGGGGGGGAATSNGNSGGASNGLFNTTPSVLTNLKSKYDQLCGNRTSFNATAIDVNRDGRKDLVGQMYCGHLPVGEAYIGPVVNALVVLVQNQDGTFSDQTLSILGSDMPSADGKVQSFAKYDFNGDGYEDLVMTMDGEDGRTQSDIAASNMKFQTLALMSNGSGAYSLTKFGANVWGSDLRLINNSAGSPVLVVLPADNGTHGWSFSNGWTQLAGYDWVSTFASIFIDPTLPNTFTTTAFNATQDNAGQYLQVWNRSGNNWTQATSTTFLNFQQKTYTDTGNSFHVGRVFGKDFIDPFLYDGCSFKLNSNSAPIPLFAMLGNEIVGGYTNGQVLNEPQGTGRWGQVNLVTMSLDNASNVVNPRIVATASLGMNYYQLACSDINGDGLQDVVVRSLGDPILMINDGNGGLKQIKSSSIPSNPSSSRYTYIYEDMDGDGIKDLLYIPLGGQSTFSAGWSYSGFQLTMYKGLRNSTLSDTN